MEKKSQPKKKTSEKDRKIKDLTDTLQMLQADFENFRKRSEAEKNEYREYSKAETISRFLPIIDNFELALNHAEKHANENYIKNENSQAGNDDEFAKGVKLIFSQMITELENMGVKKIESAGKQFNPRLHEALMADFSDKPKDIIIEEFQAGYTIGERIIRHSKVKISKGPKEDKGITIKKDDNKIHKAQ